MGAETVSGFRQSQFKLQCESLGQNQEVRIKLTDVTPPKRRQEENKKPT